MKKLFYKIYKRQSNFFTVIFAVLLLLLLTNNMVNGQKQNDLDVIRNYWLLYTDAPNSLYHYLTGEAFKMLDTRAKGIKQLQTVSEWQKRQSSVKQTLWDIIGPFTEKTSLNAKITGTVKKNGYKIENIIYESLPGFYVTASLFIPDNVKTPAPGNSFLQRTQYRGLQAGVIPATPVKPGYERIYCPGY